MDHFLVIDLALADQEYVGVVANELHRIQIVFWIAIDSDVRTARVHGLVHGHSLENRNRDMSQIHTDRVFMLGLKLC